MVSIVKKTRRIVPLYLQTAEQLRSRILNGVYPKGSALPSESELAASFGINHITLRKGLRVLADQNLIVQQHGRGTFVTYAPEENLRIGLVVDAVGGSNSRYFLWMISELTRQLGELNGNVILLPTRNVSEKELMDRFHKNRCNGLLISNAPEKLAAILTELKENAEKARSLTSLEKATYAKDVVLPDMEKTREIVDALETIVDAAFWRFPTYNDLLYSVN